jgi:hypothetical protein
MYVYDIFPMDGFAKSMAKLCAPFPFDKRLANSLASNKLIWL